MAKLQLLEGYRDRDGLDWDDAKLQLIDLQYSDVRPGEGALPPARRRAAGSSGCVDDAEVERGDARAAGGHPRLLPRRAAWRSTPTHVAAASWDSVIFDVPGRESLQRVPTLEPLRGTKAHVGALLDRCDTAEELFAR